MSRLGLLWPLLALASLGGESAPAAGPSRVLGARAPAPRPWPRDPETSPISVACPRCGAGAGVPCDRRTLGRHSYHLARVQAHGATR